MKWDLAGCGGFAVASKQGMDCVCDSTFRVSAPSADRDASLDEAVEARSLWEKLRRRELNPGLPRDRRKY